MLENLLQQRQTSLRNNCRGADGLGTLLATGVAMVVLWTGLVTAGAYVGNLYGWVVGNLINVLPVVNQAIPETVRSFGLSPGPNVNIITSQAAGTLAGTGLGFYGAYRYRKKD